MSDYRINEAAAVVYSKEKRIVQVKSLSCCWRLVSSRCAMIPGFSFVGSFFCQLHVVCQIGLG